MANRLRRKCLKAGCRELVSGGYCNAHSPERTYDQRRESAHKRGYTGQWRRAREGFLAKHPLCIECEERGFIEAATVVDHITPHKGDDTLFWDRDNWQPLCETCHNRKTVRQDGGLGNGRG